MAAIDDEGRFFGASSFALRASEDKPRLRMTEERRRPPRYALVAEGSAVGIFFPVAIVAGYLVGKWLGRWLGVGEIAAFFGAGLGVAAAFANLWRFVKRLERP